MKNLSLSFLFLASFLTLSFTADASCNWNAWFKYPQANGHYQHGKPVYVKVDVQRHHDIAYMELFVDGKYIRKESNYPYEWCKGHGNSDHYLRNLSPGKHHLKVKIRTRCGTTHYKECYIYVKGGHHNPTPGHCIKDAWFKYPQANGHYQHGKPVYVKVDPKRYQDIAYMELYVDGKYIRKESSYPYEWCKGHGNSDHYLRNLSPGKHHIKCKIVDKCGNKYYKEIWIYIDGGHHQPSHCEWDAWFKYPKPNTQYQYGKPLYVRVDPKKYQDIAYMELYVDGKYIRKESQYPYEWCKGHGNSDHYLRNLKPGKHHIKVKIVDKCGKVHYKEIYIHVGVV